MSTPSIDNAYIYTYENNVRHLAQQGVSRLRQFVSERPEGGINHHWERLGAGTASQKTSARTATPVEDLAWTRRVSVAQTWHHGSTSELEDPVQMLVDPNSNIAKAQAMAMRRAVDDIIITAFDADALDESGAAVAFDSVITQTIGDGTGAFSTSFVKDVLELFYTRDIDADVPKTMVIGPKQARLMFDEDEVVSRDYQMKQALASGYLPNYLGYNWVISTRLPSPGAGEIYCFCFTPFAIGLQVNKDITALVAQDPGLSFAWVIYSYLVMGAVRVEDEHIVRIHVTDV